MHYYEIIITIGYLVGGVSLSIIFLFTLMSMCIDNRLLALDIIGILAIVIALMIIIKSYPLRYNIFLPKANNNHIILKKDIQVQFVRVKINNVWVSVKNITFEKQNNNICKLETNDKGDYILVKDATCGEVVKYIINKLNKS